ncbi:MAG: putative nitrogen fixation protein NifT [Rhodospirillaceae bacterium]|nr:putative nitrogen fixation protein NifT [Rhodospirillaceae bacterium]
MKVMIRRKDDRILAYVAKKDLEERVVEQERPDLWGGWVRLANGWVFDMPEMPAETRLPITVEARKRPDQA